MLSNLTSSSLCRPYYFMRITQDHVSPPPRAKRTSQLVRPHLLLRQNICPASSPVLVLDWCPHSYPISTRLLLPLFSLFTSSFTPQATPSSRYRRIVAQSLRSYVSQKLPYSISDTSRSDVAILKHIYTTQVKYLPYFLILLSINLFPCPFLRLIPIGSFSPHSHSIPNHAPPSDAVIIHKHIRSRKGIGIH